MLFRSPSQRLSIPLLDRHAHPSSRSLSLTLCTSPQALKHFAIPERVSPSQADHVPQLCSRETHCQAVTLLRFQPLTRPYHSADSLRPRLASRVFLMPAAPWSNTSYCSLRTRRTRRPARTSCCHKVIPSHPSQMATGRRTSLHISLHKAIS